MLWLLFVPFVSFVAVVLFLTSAVSHPCSPLPSIRLSKYDDKYFTKDTVDPLAIALSQEASAGAPFMRYLRLKAADCTNCTVFIMLNFPYMCVCIYVLSLYVLLHTLFCTIVYMQRKMKILNLVFWCCSADWSDYCILLHVLAWCRDDVVSNHTPSPSHTNLHPSTHPHSPSPTHPHPSTLTHTQCCWLNSGTLSSDERLLEVQATTIYMNYLTENAPVYHSLIHIAPIHPFTHPSTYLLALNGF